MDKIEVEPDKGVGGVYRLTIEPIDMTKLTIGPIDHKEKPEFKVYKRGVDPPKSLICHQERIDQDNGFLIIFLIQNYGTKAVKITVKRTA